MADEPENLVLALLRAIRGDVTTINAKVDGLTTRVDGLDAKVDHLAVDLTAVKTVQQEHGRILSVLRHAIAPGEMEATNRELAEFRRELDALSQRVEVLERRRQ
jgi:hypothetical protein